MRILLLHSDFIKFEAQKQAIKDAEKIEKAEHEVKECLVVLTSVEKRDEKNPDAVIQRYVKEVDDVAKQVKADKVVIYPYVHLTTDPSSPQAALEILRKCEEELKKSYQVTRSPFGW
ncbi:hypothetical protein HYU13_03245, partial [Candidatus Woesearchaeota archaeon]|nr:hypothetical protein [Candidatus Woesearchaeota archaeon]